AHLLKNLGHQDKLIQIKTKEINYHKNKLIKFIDQAHLCKIVLTCVKLKFCISHNLKNKYGTLVKNLAHQAKFEIPRSTMGFPKKDLKKEIPIKINLSLIAFFDQDHYFDPQCIKFLFLSSFI
ncbi:hypothetical protein BpHYR1_003207, partial [Brachionus plicatilis]